MRWVSLTLNPPYGLRHYLALFMKIILDNIPILLNPPGTPLDEGRFMRRLEVERIDEGPA